MSAFRKGSVIKVAELGARCEPLDSDARARDVSVVLEIDGTRVKSAYHCRGFLIDYRERGLPGAELHAWDSAKLRAIRTIHYWSVDCNAVRRISRVRWSFRWIGGVFERRRRARSAIREAIITSRGDRGPTAAIRELWIMHEAFHEVTGFHYGEERTLEFLIRSKSRKMEITSPRD